jgi:hypothetical protein
LFSASASSRSSDGSTLGALSEEGIAPR